MFEHARKCGAQVFDGVQVKSIEFEGGVNTPKPGTENLNPGKPIKANYMIKNTKEMGQISFDYVVDASGRVGVLSTNYMKNRRYNQGLKNVANWGYWNNAKIYAAGTHKEHSPFFEALQGKQCHYQKATTTLGTNLANLLQTDESGWAWLIPLHNGTASVGVVMNQKLSAQKKATSKAANSKEYYLESLEKFAPDIMALLKDGELVSDVKAASDYSYNASSYSFPNARIVGDAGCFIDPYFSSGVHLALTGGLSAATTICASIRGDVEEDNAAKWHSRKVRDAYTNFLLVVLSAYRQIRHQDESVLADINEDNFDRAFSLFRPSKNPYLLNHLLKGRN